MFGAVAVVFLTVISTASVRYFFEMRRIAGGIVALNSATCFSAGVSARIVSTSSAKPILSISSASSRTRKRSSERSSVPFSRWSMIRPGRADDDVDAAAQGRQLHAVPLAAVDGQHVQAGQVRGVALEGLGDLERELAGGREHQRLRLLLLEVDAREDRYGERGRLAGAGLGQADDVATLQQRRDRGGLDRRGRLVADLRQGLEHPLVDPELGKARSFVVGLVCTGGLGHQSAPPGVRCSFCREPPPSVASRRCEVHRARPAGNWSLPAAGSASGRRLQVSAPRSCGERPETGRACRE